MPEKKSLKSANIKRLNDAIDRKIVVWSAIKRFVILQRWQRPYLGATSGRGDFSSSKIGHDFPKIAAITEHLKKMGVRGPRGGQINNMYVWRIIQDNYSDYKSIKSGHETMISAGKRYKSSIDQFILYTGDFEDEYKYYTFLKVDDSSGSIKSEHHRVRFIDSNTENCGDDYYFDSSLGITVIVDKDDIHPNQIDSTFFRINTGIRAAFSLHGELYISFNQYSPCKYYELEINCLPIGRGLMKKLFDEDNIVLFIANFIPEAIRNNNFINIYNLLKSLIEEL